MDNTAESVPSSAPSKPAVCPAGGSSGNPPNPVSATPHTSVKPSLTAPPTWAVIAALFQAPYWIVPPADPVQVGSIWIGCMKGQGLDLSKYIDVSTQATTIYQAIDSKDMPITNDPTQYFPPDALALFKTWMDNGCPE